MGNNILIEHIKSALNLSEKQIREKGRFKNTTFKSMEQVEERLVEQLKKLDIDTARSITLFNWIKDAI